MASDLKRLLSEKKAAIVEQWFEVILNTYHEKAVSFFRGTKDPFHNPVGHTLRKEIEGVFDQLLAGLEREAVSPFVDRIVRIRAVQDYTASQAVSFVPGLKPVLRAALEKELAADPQLGRELTAFEDQVDELTLVAFDLYMSCREQIYELKCNDIKNMYYNALRRMDVVVPGRPEPSEPDNGLPNGN